jgi:hypothetical protein
MVGPPDWPITALPLRFSLIKTSAVVERIRTIQKVEAV